VYYWFFFRTPSFIIVVKETNKAKKVMDPHALAELTVFGEAVFGEAEEDVMAAEICSFCGPGCTCGPNCKCRELGKCICGASSDNPLNGGIAMMFTLTGPYWTQ